MKKSAKYNVYAFRKVSLKNKLSLKRRILRVFAIILVKYLQRKYKLITLKNINGNQSSGVTSKLRLIQSVIYYLKCQFKAWGYFHPSPIWTDDDESNFAKLFKQKDFEEIDMVVYHNPEAVSYYHNKIYNLMGGENPRYAKEIKDICIKNETWN